mmetsp:Transcript_120780/g.327763  ORF Transcript_120780/g.327763 Transcript_120780/m.327763 type:complete len:161 (-) Transcript_120780:52-534(-)
MKRPGRRRSPAGAAALAGVAVCSWALAWERGCVGFAPAPGLGASVQGVAARGAPLEQAASGAGRGAAMRAAGTEEAATDEAKPTKEEKKDIDPIIALGALIIAVFGIGVFVIAALPVLGLLYREFSGGKLLFGGEKLEMPALEQATTLYELNATAPPGTR